MNKFQPPLIETPRLLLTWPTREQIDGYHLSIIGTRMFDTIQWDGPQGPDELHEYWEEKRNAEAGRSLEVAIIEKASDRYIGGAGLRNVDGNPAILDIGYALAPDCHGRGYATEAVGALIDEAFRNRGAERVTAMIFVGNTASRKVVEKLGFLFEGTLRRAVLKRGAWLDEWLLAITRPDWESR
jgi:RimJ/RimL family protein N-acetyltransferase